MQDAKACMADDACWRHLLDGFSNSTQQDHRHKSRTSSPPTAPSAASKDEPVIKLPAQITVAATEAHAVELGLQQPAWVDAVVVFEGAGRQPCATGALDATESAASRQLQQFVIRMNHSDVPPTRLLADTFDVFPSRNNGLSLYQRWDCCGYVQCMREGYRADSVAARVFGWDVSVYFA